MSIPRIARRLLLSTLTGAVAGGGLVLIASLTPAAQGQPDPDPEGCPRFVIIVPT